MTREIQAHINLAALRHNFTRVRELVGDRSILSMIKADGYGHGLLRVARALENTDAFGVASIGEALALRKAGIDSRIVVMSGFFNATDLALFVENNITAVIHHRLQIDLLEKSHLRKPLSIWFKIDTGMHRLGFCSEEVEVAYQRLNALDCIQQPIVCMTHLADADNSDHSFTQQQLNRFEMATQKFSGPKSVCNSAAILAYKEALADWVRPGIMLYGVSPFPGRNGLQEALELVMTLSATLMAVKSLKKGDLIGYGCTWQCPEDMPVGVVTIGYGDGYPRHAKNGTPVLINDTICPLVGRVSMDMMTVDLRPKPNAKVGDQVVLWGQGLPIEEVAECAETIPYELLCGVTQRATFVET